MINFTEFISLLIPILIFYLSLYLPLKKELEDFLVNNEVSPQEYRKIEIRNKIKFFLNLATIILILVLLIIYKLPSIYNLLCIIKKYISEIEIDFTYFIPFRADFFYNEIYRFSYILGAVISLIYEGILIFYYYTEMIPIYIEEFIFIICFVLISGYIEALINNLVSIILSLYLTSSYIIICSIINICIFWAIFCILLLIIDALYTIFF